MLLWVDKAESKEGKVSAVPRGVDVKLREMVLKYQIHNCQPGRTCTYSFPYALWKEDGLDESGIRYKVKMPR